MILSALHWKQLYHAEQGRCLMIFTHPTGGFSFYTLPMMIGG